MVNIVEACVQQADERFRQDDLQGAKEALNRALSAAPTEPQLLVALGNILLRLGDNVAACAEFKKAALANPGFAPAYVNWSAALYMLGRYGEAEIAARRALELEPSNGDALKTVGLACFKQGRYSEAVQAYAQVVWQNPSDLDGLMTLSECYAQVKDYSSALLLYEKVLEIAPDHEFARQRHQALIQQQAAT